MYNKIKTTFLLLMLFFSIILGGCSSLRQADEKVGKFLSGGKSEDKEATKENIPEELDSSGLSREQKASIDLWLETNGFNRYGDVKNTFYTGGTPLFNEATGETKERYDYILEKHPDILSKI